MVTRMDRVPIRLHGWWSGLDGHARRIVSALVLVCIGYTAHYLVYSIPQPFFIEDAGISFAYARNFVNGEGFATYAGGPRVEGFSNPSWTFLIALLYAVGVPTFTASKILGWAFGVATLPISWALVRRALPDRADAPISRDTLALIGPIMLAASVQFVVWNASGLENSLFCFLLALGMWRCVVELEDGGRPYSAFVFFLLCASRPEGIMYALIAGGLRGWHALFSAEGRALSLGQRARVILNWTAVLVIPLIAFHAWRYWYFAWEFPNTYYAKLGTGRAFRPFSWTRKGWKYIGQWAGPHGGPVLLGIIVLGLVGLGKRTRWLALGLVLTLGLLLGWDGEQGLGTVPSWFTVAQDYWIHARVWTLLALVPLLWFASMRSEAWRARGLLWLNAAAGIFFVVYVGGDWMKAHRWFNLFCVPLTAVAAVGLAEIIWMVAGTQPVRWFESFPHALRMARSRGGLATLLLLLGCGGWVANEIRLTLAFSVSPETTVRDIHRRVKYMGWVQERLDVDRITLLDVDMGAHMYFTDWEIVDIAGLVDVPMARHSDFNKKFLREYLFKERKPDFAHVHGGWARASRIHKMAEFKDRYVEIPGYPIGKRKLHIGNHINKALFVTKDSKKTPVATFAGGVHLVDLEIPSPLIQPGARVFVETNWRAAYRKSGFRVLIALTAEDGTRAVSSFGPGYDWYSPKEWKKNETVNGKFKVTVPKNFPQGAATIAVLLLDEKTGKPLGIPSDTVAAEGTIWESAAYHSATVVTIADKAAVEAAAEDDRQQALAAGIAGACEDVWRHWKNATRHGPFRTTWIEFNQAEIRDASATCFVARAETAEGHEAQVEALTQAQQMNHHLPRLLAVARPLAAAMEERGDLKWAADELDEAYEAFRSSVRLDPRRSWARRKAEDVRDLRLRITRPGRKKKRG